jgi:hypothetical protein
MWLRLIGGGLVMAVGLALFISVGVTPIAPGCARFYGTLGLALLIPGLVFFAKGLKEYAGWVRRFRQR